MKPIIFQRAKISDLSAIVELLTQDDLGKSRESLDKNNLSAYEKAFAKISSDKNQYLMIGKIDDEIVATCHLTIMPSLTFKGTTRLQIEAVRVKISFRGQKIGEKMMSEIKDFARQNDCAIIQLTTNKSRFDAKRFYEKQGFVASHEGMKFDL